MFAFQDTQAEATHSVDVAFTDRHGGFSGGPYASLNLAAASGDDPAIVERNVDRVVRRFVGVPEDGPAPTVVRMRQVHGSHVQVVESSSDAGEPPVADALVTRLPGVVLMVRVADCVPVLLADLRAGVVGAVHAGRPGLVAGVVPRAVEAMQTLGAASLRAWIGPHVCGACYEVPDDMRADVSSVVPAAYAQTSWGTPSVDVGAGVLGQLREAGVDVVDRSRCTIEDDDLFSYRRQGRASGRLAGLIRLRP